jgi:hypothetical protein
VISVHKKIGCDHAEEQKQLKSRDKYIKRDQKIGAGYNGYVDSKENFKMIQTCVIFEC